MTWGAPRVDLHANQIFLQSIFDLSDLVLAGPCSRPSSRLNEPLQEEMGDPFYFFWLFFFLYFSFFLSILIIIIHIFWLFFFCYSKISERDAARMHAPAKETPHRPEDLHWFLPSSSIYPQFAQCEFKFTNPQGFIAALAWSQKPGYRYSTCLLVLLRVATATSSFIVVERLSWARISDAQHWCLDGCGGIFELQTISRGPNFPFQP